jgi:hypothetical protein
VGRIAVGCLALLPSEDDIETNQILFPADISGSSIGSSQQAERIKRGGISAESLELDCLFRSWESGEGPGECKVVQEGQGEEGREYSERSCGKSQSENGSPRLERMTGRGSEMEREHSHP